MMQNTNFKLQITTKQITNHKSKISKWKSLFVIWCLIFGLYLIGAPFVYSEPIKEIGTFHWKHIAADGTVIAEWETRNALADEGESMFLDCTLRATSCPTTFYLRLFNDTPAETDTLALLTGEPSTYGYAAQEIPRTSGGWPTLALDSGDYQATSSTETFSASGGSWGPVTYAVLATSSDSSGKLVAYTALSTSRTLASGESLQVTYKLKLQ